MDKNKEKKLLDSLPLNERKAVENFPDHSRGKVLEKLQSGYTVSDYNYYEIEVKKGYAYYGISRGGSMYIK